jgi:cytosine/adenosine deaminase-related metal-dependent hydrolase
MRLSNLNTIKGEQIDILIEGDKIKAICSHESKPGIQLQDVLVFPGLINSHDHLDFNCFPKLGNRTYNNYVEWGDDIHKQNKETIDAVLRIPKELRIQWGLYKNLLNGITTVVNHGPKLQVDSSLINVFQETSSLHSVQLEKKWRLKLNWPFTKSPVSVHVGEGTDKATSEEIDRLLKWNLFRKQLVGIHGITMNSIQAKKFKALVWCPDSNYFLIGKTAEIDKLKGQTKILFGTDSTLSASWNIWEHLRVARNAKLLSDNELLEALTANASEVWKILNTAKLEAGYYADIVIAKQNGLKGKDAFYALNPEDILLVICKGQVRLFEEEIKKQLKQHIDLNRYSEININKNHKYVFGDMPQLIKKIKDFYPKAEFPVTV